MQLIKKNILVIAVVALAALALWGYETFFSQGPTALLSSADQSPSSQNLLLALTNLQSIKLDPTLFSDPVFESLTDFGVTIPPETPGRADPFAPPGASGAATSTGQ